MSDNYSSGLQISPIRQSILPSFIVSKYDSYLRNSTRPWDNQGPATPNHAFAAMYERWELPIYLMGGTLAMREARQQWLPQEKGEEDDLYYNRLKRTVLYGAYSKTIKTLSSLPFNAPVQVVGAPAELDYLLQEANGNDESLEAFCEKLLADLLVYGIAHILVEYPTVEGEKSLLEEREENIRPYFSRVDPLKLISWKTTLLGSKNILDEIRIFEDVVEDDPENEWSETYARQVRVIRPDTIDLYKTDDMSNQGTNYVLNQSMPNSLEKVGLVTIYGNKTGYMQAAPMLEELAWLNLRHYQKLSDLDNIEHVANVPFAFMKGVPAEELDNIVIGAHRVLKSTSEKADIKYVEHSGAAIGKSQESIQQLESRMLAMGAKMVEAKVATRETAKGKSIDTAESTSILQNLVIDLEQGIAEAYQLAGEWIDLKFERPKVNIGDKLGLSVDANLLTSLIEMARAGNMTFEDLGNEMKRRNMLSESTNLKKGDPAMQGDPNAIQGQEEEEQT